MHLPVHAEGQILGHNLRRSNLTVGIGQGSVIAKSDRVIVGEIIG
jgi:hypothetical protein